MEKELCRGRYRAQQVPGVVILFAEGLHPTSGFEVCLEQGPERVFPPIYQLFHEAPTGIVLPMVTPFQKWAMFPAAEPVDRVTVKDADGEHEVEVEQVPDLVADSMKAGISPFLEAQLWMRSVVWVNRMPGGPPRPVRIPLSLYITNSSRHDLSLSVPTPCDEHFWELTNEQGEVVQRFQRPPVCTDQVVELKVPAVSTLRRDVELEIQPGVLLPEQWYRLDYRYMGLSCDANFYVRFAF